MRRFFLPMTAALAACSLCSCQSLKDAAASNAAVLEGQEVKISWTAKVKGVPVTFSLFGVIPEGAFSGGKQPVSVDK